ncbi:hypothetical protein EON65_23265 [archaeon]|nr:MAG: hypothetical protein EON65_23265 [archaeon]
MRDNEEVEKLKKVIKEYKEREGRWRIKLADLDAQLETIQKEKAEYTKIHTDEVQLCLEISLL